MQTAPLVEYPLVSSGQRSRQTAPLLSDIQVRGGIVEVGLTETTNLTTRALDRTKNALTGEILTSVGYNKALILRIGDVGLDTAGINFLSTLKDTLRERGIGLVIFCDAAEQLRALQGASSLSPVVKNRMVDAVTLAQRFARSRAA